MKLKILIKDEPVFKKPRNFFISNSPRWKECTMIMDRSIWFLMCYALQQPTLKFDPGQLGLNSFQKQTVRILKLWKSSLLKQALRSHLSSCLASNRLVQSHLIPTLAIHHDVTTLMLNSSFIFGAWWVATRTCSAVTFAFAICDTMCAGLDASCHGSHRTAPGETSCRHDDFKLSPPKFTFSTQSIFWPIFPNVERRFGQNGLRSYILDYKDRQV